MKGMLYTDGGARGNPGPAGLGSVLFSEDGNLLGFDAAYGGRLTNNQAEYKALKLGIELALREQVTDLICYLDSELIVKQLSGEYKVKDAKMKKEKAEIDELLEEFDDVVFIHVLRENNKHADKLVNIVLDAKGR